MRILGSNFFGHDSAFCLLDTSRREIVAESTERTTRIKNDDIDIGPAIRANAIGNVDLVRHGSTSLNSVDGEVVTPLSIKALKRLVLAREIFRPRYAEDLARPAADKAVLLAMAFFKTPLVAARFAAARAVHAVTNEQPVTAVEMIRYIGESLARSDIACRAIKLYDHHFCHAASAYYFSPFALGEKAVVLTLDGSGDGYFSKLYLFEGTSRTLLGSSRSRVSGVEGGGELESLGTVYTAFAVALEHTGIEGEGNLTALAAYGTPDAALYAELRAAITVSAEGFAFDPGKIAPFHHVGRLRLRAERLGERNFAATVQKWLEDVVVEHLTLVHARHGTDNLCLAGGVAANIVMNLAIFERTGFRRLFVFPAMGDEGIAAGSAALGAIEAGEDIRWLAEKQMPYYGHRISRDEIRLALQREDSLVCEDLGAAWPERAARAIAEGRIIAVVHGHMEFGPRALGNRSILANPVSVAARDRINASVKRRPWFQPCCPSILEEERERLFASSLPHKHMAIAFRMREEFRSQLPGIVHEDGTVRAQFVEEKDNPDFHRLLKCMQELIGFGAVINTSFNFHGRPIVRTAEDALEDFRVCGIDELYLEGHRIRRH